MTRLRIGVLGVVLAVIAAANAAQPAANEAAARLLSIDAEGSGGAYAVVIEASDPVAYSVSRPDPLTVLVDLRDARAASAKNRFRPSQSLPVTAVLVDEMTAPDGAPLTRVMMQLREPLAHTATTNKNRIRIGFTKDSVAPAANPASATALVSIGAAAQGAITTVTLKGNGWLAPSALDEVTGAGAPRVIVDLPGVVSQADAAAALAQAGVVSRVTTSLASQNPVVTRVAIDLKKRVAFRPERSGATGADYAVVFDEKAPIADNGEEAFGPNEIKDPNAAPAPASPAVPAAPANQPRKAGSIAEAAGSQAIDPMNALKTPGTATPPRAANQAGVQPRPGQPPTPPPAMGQPAQEGPRQYQGHLISLDLQGMPLRDVLRMFAGISGLNMVIDSAIDGSVDIILTEVPWDQALEIVLRNHNLGYTIDGTVVRIARLETLRGEEEERAKLEKAREEAGELTVRTYALSYAQAQMIADMLSRGRIISPRGQTVVDSRTNTLIITDLSRNLQTAESLIKSLDRPEPQVEIEARIVQTTRDFARSLGIQWGLNGRVSPAVGNTTGLAFPNNGSIGGRTGGVQGSNDVRGNESDLTSTAVNLGVSAATSAIGMSLGSINGAFNLDVALSALERSGKGRILSTPRVTTQNNNPAEMYQGIQIPIQTVANNTVTVTFKDAALSLRVTPQVTAAGTVIMHIQLENAAADFSRQVNNIPPIDTQRAVTRVQIDDGATTVIGGIFVSREQATQSRTPVLHRIPLLGWLFKRDEATDESRELLIFITPRILRTQG